MPIGPVWRRCLTLESRIEGIEVAISLGPVRSSFGMPFKPQLGSSCYMLFTTLGRAELAIPTRDDWEAYTRGELPSLRERPVVLNRMTQRMTQRALEEGVDRLDYVRMVLHYQDWGANPKWWPIYLYCEADMLGSLMPTTRWSPS